MLIGFAIYLTVGIILMVVEIENAPLYDEEHDVFIYKEWYTIFGIKIKRNKK